MKNLINRIEDLEAIARHWQLDNKVYTSFDQHNNQVREDTWTQKEGRIRGPTIEFETPRAALDWVISQLDRGPAQISVDDIRDIMDFEDREMFDFMFPDAPERMTWFDLYKGQDFWPRAIWYWRRRTLAGVKYNDWWEKTNARLDDLLQNNTYDKVI